MMYSIPGSESSKLLNFVVPDPCVSEPCDVNAICEREGLLTDGFTCTCQSPFTEGNGFNCSGISIVKFSSALSHSNFLHTHDCANKINDSP